MLLLQPTSDQIVSQTLFKQHVNEVDRVGQCWFSANDLLDLSWEAPTWIWRAPSRGDEPTYCLASLLER